ncbi:hypothetical protein BGX26_009821 [Mortierella sp. AD094]|nr:hypothetical protein BGX26_009821 [Mortierella sp. AD094]
MTDIKSRYLVPTFSGLVAQIGLSVGVSVVCVGFFEYNRRKKTLEYLYSPRCRLNVDPSPPVSRKLLGWVMPTIRLPEEFYINNIGLDAVMYLRFLKMCLQFCIFNGFVVGAILLPIHYTAGGNLTEVPRLSIANVPRESNLLWAHVFLTYVITISWMFLLFKNYWQWMDLRREYTLQRIRQGEIAERSIFISRLPSNLRSDSALRQYFESLKMGPVESATVVQHCGRLSQKIDRRESALNELEKAHISLACSVLESIKSGHFSMGTINAITTDKALTPSNSAADIDYATLKSMVALLYRDKKRYNKTRKSIFAKSSNEGSSSIGDITGLVHDKPAPLSVNPALCDSNTIDIIVHQNPGPAPGTGETETSTFTIWNVLAALRRQSLDEFQPTRTEKRFKGGSRVNSIEYFMKKYNRLDKKVEELRDGSLRYKSTTYGFVTFKHHLSAQLCAQSKIDSRPQGLSARLAMEPRDVLWSNLTASFKNRFTRFIVVNLSIWALIIFWIFPTSSFLLLTSLGALSSQFEFLKPILEASPLIQSLLQNILPIVFVTIFLALAPVIIIAISKQELPVSHSELEGKVLRRYYHFLIFNVLFVFMVGTAILGSIITLIQQPTNIFVLLADNLPSGSTFFVFYIVFNTCTHFLELVQVWAQLVIHLFVTSKKITRSPRSLQRATTPWSFQYYYYYPQNILAFVITLIYSIISPLILLAAIVFFGCALVIFKYQLAYCYVRKYENSGRYFRHVFQYTSDGLIIFQITMIGVLWLNEALVGGFFIVALLGFTIYFKIMCSDLFRSRTKFLPLDTGLRNFESSGNSVKDEIESNHRSSISTRSSVIDSGLRRRPVGNIGKANRESVHSVSSANLACLGEPANNIASIEQPKSFPRLRATANQSDKYKKLVHSESTEDVTEEIQEETFLPEVMGEKEAAGNYGQDVSETADIIGPISQVPTEQHESTKKNKVEEIVMSSPIIVSERNASHGDGVLADGYFAGAVGPTHFLYTCPGMPSHFDHVPSRIVYQDQTSEFETYIHPALLKPLSRKMWLPKNPLYEHWNLDDTAEIDFALNSSATNGKLKFRSGPDNGATLSPRFEYREYPQRRNTGGSNLDDSAGVTPTSNWEGCLSHPVPSAIQRSDSEVRTQDIQGRVELIRAMSGVEGSQVNNLTPLSRKNPLVSQKGAPLLSPEFVYATRASTGSRDDKAGGHPHSHISLEPLSTLPQRPHCPPLNVSGVAQTHDGTPQPSASQGVSSTPHSPAINASATSSRPTAHGGSLPHRNTIHLYSPHNHTSSGIGTVSSNSIRKTQPTTNRGFLNMIFGRLDDEDAHDDQGEKQRFGYETGGAWLSRRASHDHRVDDDDEDDEDDDDSGEEHTNEPEEIQVPKTTGTVGEGALGLEELQLAQPSHLDLADSLPASTEMRQSGSFIQRTMNFLRDSEK